MIQRNAGQAKGSAATFLRAHGETATPFPCNWPSDGSRPDQRGRSRMRRREFIAGLAGATTWPLAARAQQSHCVRRVGVLMGADENDPEAKAQFSELMKELAELGWTDGRNLQIDIRRAGANADRLQPDVLVAQATAPTAALQQETKTIPIVFAWLEALEEFAYCRYGVRPAADCAVRRWMTAFNDKSPKIGNSRTGHLNRQWCI